MELRCPICKSGEFLAFNGRDNARCKSCQAMERTRLLWMILEKHGLFRPGLRVMHVAPELPLAKRFSELLDERYFACDVNAARYASTFTTIRPLDLCADLVKLPSRVFDIIIHSHVLEHLRCAPEAVLGEFERLLKPGGQHFVSVPISGEETREDLSDELSDAERAMLFGQHDHMRVFGRSDLPKMLDHVWGKCERHHIEPIELFGAEELERAAIPNEAWSGISSHSIFHHVRPLTRAVRVSGSETAARAAATPAPRAKPKLIVHIGMPKAGTTSLQRWLSANADAAREAGLDYWDAAENHSEAMFMAFADAERIARGKMWFQQDGRARARRSMPARASTRSSIGLAAAPASSPPR
jgi:SAM-dependent methyltransferase